VADALDGLGLPYVIVSDRDVTAARLRGKTVAPQDRDNIKYLDKRRD
jgi:hypothetical protein